MNELTKSIKGENQKTRPMHEWVYLSIMGEYLICPDEFLENPRIQKAYAMNDEPMLRKILESEY